MTSRDGYQWTKATGLVQGVPSIGVIEPSTNLANGDSFKFDLIVIGAGYAGLTAVRDAAIAGLKVLLLEGRDRIGGRSWSSNIGGYPFEMGGTWVTWGQPHVWREISRYGMRDKLEISQDTSCGVNTFSLTSKLGRREMSHQEEDQLVASAMKKFVNVDGEYGRRVIPFPHDEFAVADTKKYDSMSAADRLKQIEHSLTPDEYTAVCGFVTLFSCGTLENTSFYEFLHWWALCNYSYEYCVEYLMKYKFKAGQSSFAINFFKEALSTGNLSYAFNHRVSKIEDDGEVSVEANGKSFRAAKVISAVPLNVLNNINFLPALPHGKKTAADIGHINKCAKVHAECTDRDLRSWSGIDYPNNKLTYAFGDGTTPTGNTHIVAFGASYNHLDPEKDIDQTIKALQDFVPMNLERVVFHNWANDEFAKGAWFFSPPNLVSEHLEDMRASHGNILFASADWAVGWRSFIDGAIEEGTRAAMNVVRELKASSSNQAGNSRL